MTQNAKAAAEDRGAAGWIIYLAPSALCKRLRIASATLLGSVFLEVRPIAALAGMFEPVLGRNHHRDGRLYLSISRMAAASPDAALFASCFKAACSLVMIRRSPDASGVFLLGHDFLLSAR